MNELTVLANKYMTDKGSYFFENTNMKGHLYTELYDKLFSDLRDKPISLLEIGVSKGASLLMWNEYFNNATIIGADINTHLVDKSKPLGVEGGGWSEKPSHMMLDVYYCDQGNIDSLRNLESLIPGSKYDIIIDDGSHQNHHQQITFNTMINSVKDDGWYIIEDIQCGKHQQNSTYMMVCNYLASGSFHNKNMTNEFYILNRIKYCIISNMPNDLCCIFKLK